jgi:hypothetical protein
MLWGEDDGIRVSVRIQDGEGKTLETFASKEGLEEDF